MRPTRPLLGVKGLFPLIRDHCPAAISYPTRYEGIRGKRLAIDATLLVQRLVFAPDPHEQRHLIGLYRLLKTLRSHNVAPIMVFDHLQARLPQKERERERRRLVRSLSRRRANSEKRRGERLKELEQILTRIQALSEEQRRQVKDLLVKATATYVEDDVLAAMEEDHRQDPEFDQLSLEEDPEDALLHASILSRLDETEELLDRLASSTTPLKGTSPAPWDTIAELESSSLSAIAQRLSTLKQSFESESGLLKGDVSAPGKETTAQAALTALEADIYETLSTETKSAIGPGIHLAESLAEVADRDELLQATLEEASQKNAMLSQNYTRQSSSLSTEVLESSARLCSMLGVPVLWTGSGERSGPLAGKPHEAEAVASMLVKHGWADVVASEDSDVVLYEVPLLRGLLGAKAKMEIVDSALVRKSLFPAEQEEESREKMLEFALLAGTDYNRTLPGVAARTAVKLVQEHGSIVNILRHFPKKYRPPDGLTWQAYKRELNAARTVFRKPPSIRRYLPLLRHAMASREGENGGDVEQFMEKKGIRKDDLHMGPSAAAAASGFGEGVFGDGESSWSPPVF
jgi:flap endonuclease-1